MSTQPHSRRARRAERAIDVATGPVSRAERLHVSSEGAITPRPGSTWQRSAGGPRGAKDPGAARCEHVERELCRRSLSSCRPVAIVYGTEKAHADPVESDQSPLEPCATVAPWRRR